VAPVNCPNKKCEGKLFEAGGGSCLQCDTCGAVLQVIPINKKEKQYKKCSLCSYSFVLADTEDWEFPLCNDCYEKFERQLKKEEIETIKRLAEAEAFRRKLSF